MLQDVDDITTWVLEGPPLSLTQYFSVMRKVQTIICLYVSPDPFDSPDLDAQTFSLGLTPFVPSYPSRAGTSYLPPSTGATSYAPPPPSEVGLSFDAPPPLSTACSAIPHMSISRASSSDSDEYGDNPSDDVTQAQQFGFGHRMMRTMMTLMRIVTYQCIEIKKKTTHSRWEITRFTKEHTCLVQDNQNKHRNMTSKFISKVLSHLVANDPDISVSNIIQEVQVLLQIGFIYKRACCGKWQEYACLMLMYQTYIRRKLKDEHINPIFIRLGTRTFGEMLLTI
ncbi:hypothetical protein M9H77_13078 [Catharanthus roseus]|uniref:Uncharacterized protein n=1 Tax=Catharanthus roseus TaxID=4058 RepID=A0ACC0BJE3_CATRO|nr:hypothetical protein M9H77_13078 [Catharanthus roseus]